MHETQAEMTRNRQATNMTEMLYAEQVKLLYKNASMAIVATAVNSSILTFILWNVISHRVLILWLFCNFLIALPRYILVRRYNHTSIIPAEANKWGAWLIIGLALSGMVWGSAAVFLFAPESIAHQVFLAFVLAGMVAGGLVTFSAIRGAFLTYSLPALIPIIVRFFAQGDDIHMAMGAMTLLFTILVFISVQRIHDTIISSLKLQFENSDLVIDLSKEKGRIEGLNAKLQSKISEQKQIEKALTSERQQLLSIFDSIDEIVYVSDPKTYEILYVNRAFRDTLQKDPVGSICYREFQGLEAPCDFCTNEIILKNKGKPYQWNYYNPILTQDFWITDRIIRWPDGRDVRFEIAINITRQKQAEKELRESEEKARAIMNAITETILLIDERGMVLDANIVIARMLGKTLDELIGSCLYDLFPPALAQSRKAADEVFRTGKAVRIEDVRKGNNFDINYYPVFDLQGKVVQLAIFASDVTEKKHLEAQLQQAQKLEAIGTLAGGIAHDFNNILAAVIGYAELAKMKAPEDSDVIADLDEVFKAGLRARDLVRQILAASQQQEKDHKPIQIKFVVKEALKLLRATLPSDIEMKEDIASYVGIINADPSQMHQVIMNLCTNAGHAMQGDGGVLEVKLQNVDFGLGIGDVKDEKLRSKIRILKSETGLDPGPYLRLTVSDTGHGITHDVEERIFDPYFTTKEKGEGTGLGLSVVHGIVKDHGGTIMVYSEPGKGSTFHVYLPLIRGQAVKPEINEHAPVLKGNERILFIDDEQALADMGKQMLERLGYEVTIRTSSIEALELFHKKSDQFDLVITDMTMPKMTGDKLAKELMKIRRDIPVILCTGFSERISEEKAKEMGIKAFTMKPIVMRDMTKTVRKVLDEM
ncbi:MAG: ATP-binding protein [Thermodesulfobacteriota bacterium]|nr:ATP-binding protein [Thermodesulfobacteriota bacterium]